MKKVIIIGAGPGGLAAGVLLSSKGYDVHIYEKDHKVGGRMQGITLGDFTFDTGPTFLMDKVIIEHLFKESGRALEDFVKLMPIDPLYDLIFKDTSFKPTIERQKMRKNLEETYPGHVRDYFDFLDKQKDVYNRMKPLFKMPFHKKRYYLKPAYLKNIITIHSRQSVYKKLKKRFTDENLIHGMSFQTKYLGMASWQIPSFFTILSYLEHKNGLYHVEGGLQQINHAMKEIIEKNGGKVYLDKPVKRLIVRKRVAYGVQFEDDTNDMAKIIIANPDFGYFAKHLIKDKHKKRYTDKKIDKLDYSISTFMMYLGLDKTYQLEHHSFLFADEYNKSVKDITTNLQLPEDINIYIHNPSKLDKTLTKNKNHSALYILVPVPNNKSSIQWDEVTKTLRTQVIQRIQDKTHINDLEKHIVEERIITPKDWEYGFNTNLGSVYSLSHTRNQLFYKRPHNKYNDLKNVYLVGGGTHPGGSLSSIYQSAIITTKLITNT